MTNKINEVTLKDLKLKFGNIDNLIEFSQLGTKNIKDILLLKELLINKINIELSEMNFQSAKIIDIGFFYSKTAISTKINITIFKSELPTSLQNIFTNNKNFTNYIYKFCDEHNNTAKKMTIQLPFLDTTPILIYPDKLTLDLIVVIS